MTHEEVDDVYKKKVKAKRAVLLIEHKKYENYSLNRITFGHNYYVVGANNDDHFQLFRNKEEEDQYNQEYDKLFEELFIELKDHL